MNPNNSSAEIYDLIYDSLKPISVTEEEVSLITSKLQPGARVLDVGGGTGRHAILLTELGYKVDVVDSSPGMLKNLKTKAEAKGLSLKLIHDDIFNVKLKDHEYDMCVLFWNSFNEIALNKKHALKLLSKLKSSITPEGSILINIDDSKKIDPSKFNFSTLKIHDNKEYKVHWETVEFHKKSNIAISKEQVTVLNNDGDIIQNIDSFIKQKYWHLEEIRDICREVGLKLQKLQFKQSGELYLEIK